MTSIFFGLSNWKGVDVIYDTRKTVEGEGLVWRKGKELSLGRLSLRLLLDVQGKAMHQQLNT